MVIKRFHRFNRISQEIRRKVAVILQHRINDPRIGIVTVSGVIVSKDLMYAKVFVTFLDRYKTFQIEEGMHLLKDASGFVRYLLSKVMYIRIMPQLIFVYDYSLLEGIKMCNLIKQIVHCN